MILSDVMLDGLSVEPRPWTTPPYKPTPVPPPGCLSPQVPHTPESGATVKSVTELEQTGVKVDVL